MLSRRIVHERKLLTLSRIVVTLRNTQHASNTELSPNLETILPAHAKKKAKREPFAKNLFIGKVDTEFLAFPEAQSDLRHTEFMEWLKPVNQYVSQLSENNSISLNTNIVNEFNALGISRAILKDGNFKGLECSNTEITAIIESLSTIPSLGLYYIKHNLVPLQLLSKYGTEEQKERYIPKIISGKIIPAICITEIDSGPNIKNMNTIAELSTCLNYWILNGTKMYVPSGKDANFFLVLARGTKSSDQYVRDKSMSMFLVERDFGGITCTETKETIGMQELSCCTIKFENTEIPKDNIVGDIGSATNILIDLFTPGNQNVAPVAVNLLRKFLNLFCIHVLQRKHLDRDMYELESVQEVIGQISNSLYAMESVLYLTVGNMDQYEDQDSVLEKAIVQSYCATECTKSIYKGLQVIGAQTYLKDNPYMKIFNESLSLILFDSCTIDTKSYISLLGLQYAGKHLSQTVRKIRNPFKNPDYFFRNLFNKEESLGVFLEEYLHPSYKETADILEKCIIILKKVVLQVLSTHGTEVIHREADLRRISEIVSQIYVLIAVLARSSRAYCIGVRNANLDRQMALNFSLQSIAKIEVLANEIGNGRYLNGDEYHKLISESIFSTAKYSLEHPLIRNY